MSDLNRIQLPQPTNVPGGVSVYEYLIEVEVGPKDKNAFTTMEMVVPVAMTQQKPGEVQNYIADKLAEYFLQQPQFGGNRMEINKTIIKDFWWVK